MAWVQAAPTHENVGSATLRRRSGYDAQEAAPTKIVGSATAPICFFLSLRGAWPRGNLSSGLPVNAAYWQDELRLTETHAAIRRVLWAII